MKNIILLSILILLISFNQTVSAQLLGKWVIPIGTNNSPDEMLVMEFMENDLIQSSTIIIPEGLISSADQIGDGAFSSNYELDYYIVSDYLFYGAENTQWNAGALGGFVSEFEIIPRPQNPGEYYMIYCERTVDKNLESHLRLNHVWFEDGEYHIGADQSIAADIHEGTMAAFAITDETAGERKIYTASQSFWSKWGDHPASLRSYIITEDGIDWNTFDEIIVSEDSPFEPDDFVSYNLEMKTESNGDVVISWISQSSASNSKVFVVVDESEEKYNLNKGRIGGIEFSSLHPEVMYVSCADTGIIAINYNNGNLIEYLAGSENYGHTFLQTAPDGHIYAVSDDGAILGRINQSSGLFEPEAFPIPNYSVATYREFDNNRYYLLPENHRQYEALTATSDTTTVSCPGYTDGSATVFPTGGTPPYTYQWFDPQGQLMEGYTDATALNLGVGIYTCIITDTYPNSITLSIEITIPIDLFDFNEFQEISISDTWTNENFSFLLGFKVKQGIELILDNCNFEFSELAKIVVEDGGRLIVNNSTLDHFTECPTLKWKGIEVWGDKTKSQYPDPYNGTPCEQGYLALNGSTVMNAENAVSLWAEEARIWATSGGIVKAINTDFINNTRAVHFVPYQNFLPIPPSYPQCNNLSYFKNCNFSLNYEYIDNTMFYKHVDLHGVSGIDFYQCDFSLSASGGVSQWNNGIASYGSKFKVDAGCDQPIFPCPEQNLIPSTFSGFYRAISAHGSGLGTPVYEVWNAEFTNNTTGIYNILVPNAVMVDNDFNIGLNGTTDGDNCDNVSSFGIDVHAAAGYAIENNYFTKISYGNPGNYVGIRLDSTWSFDDIVYNNELTGLSGGNLAEGENRSDPKDDATGVEYLCNDNSDNNIDFHVANFSEIGGRMGSSNKPSGNTLSQDAQWQFLNDYTQDIQYYYYDGDPVQVLTLYTVEYVDPEPVSTENDCLDHYGGGGTGINVVLSGTEKTLKQQAYNQNIADYTITLDLINTLRDGGDTPLMEHEIETAWPDEMWVLRADLLANSPHLSFEVLKDVADRCDVFPESVQFDIFAANPDEMKYDFLTYLETKTQPMPQYMVDMLRQVGYGSSYKTVLKNQLATYWGDAVQAAQDIIRSELFDSISDLNEVRLWLSNIGGYQADKQIIATYLQEGDFASAQSLLAQLPTTYALSGDDLLAYNDYNTMMQLQINLMQQGRNIFELNSSELATVNLMATQGYGSAKKQAQGILEYAYNQHFYDCPSLPDSLTLKQHHASNVFNREEAIQASVKPNPAHTWVAFDYSLPFSEDEGEIVIIDITGQIIESIHIDQNKGQKVLDTRHISAGVYIYKVESAGYTTSGKLIIR